MDRRVHMDPAASWRALTGSRCGLRRLPELSGIRPHSAPANQLGVRDASDALSCTPAD